MFSCEFCQIYENTFFTEHLWTTASEEFKLKLKNLGNIHCILVVCSWTSLKILRILLFISYFLNISELHFLIYCSWCWLVCFFFYKQPVFKKPALEWQIAEQLSGLNLLSLSNNKNYILKKSEAFPL